VSQLSFSIFGDLEASLQSSSANGKPERRQKCTENFMNLELYLITEIVGQYPMDQQVLASTLDQFRFRLTQSCFLFSTNEAKFPAIADRPQNTSRDSGVSFSDQSCHYGEGGGVH
jgi:hypothetical protein